MSKTADLELRCEDAEATRRVGAAVGRAASAGTVALLEGQLGAGKTVFAQGVGAGLGAPSVVNSPTFVLVNEHLGGRLPLRHADLYRLDDPELIAELGLLEAAEDGVLVVEWPERAAGALPADHLLVRIVPLTGTAEGGVGEATGEAMGEAAPRRLELEASGPLARAALEAVRRSAAAFV